MFIAFYGYGIYTALMGSPILQVKPINRLVSVAAQPPEVAETATSEALSLGG